MAQEAASIESAVRTYGNESSALIQVLLEIQRQSRWLPRESLKQVSERLDVPLTQIYHVSTFYKAFSLVPKGKHSMCVCLGTACQVRGAPRLLEKVVDVVGVKPGATSADMRVSLDTVNCLGCCALGPVLTVDGEYYSNPSSKEIEDIAAACK
jgi:NADH-quinone oxidoreductase subunit E